MFRAVLLASPLALVLVVSCSSSDSADFKDTGPASAGSTGATSSTSGASAGGTSSQAGSNASAGSNATGGSNASGGKGNTGGNGNTAGNQNMAGKGNGNAGTANGNGGTVNGNAGAPTDMAGAGPGNGGAPGAGGADMGGANGGPLCPDIFGNYKINGFDGNCSELNKNALQSIQGNDVTCQAHFVSLAANPNGPVGVNGGAAIDENGDFTGAMLMLNKTMRNPCSGTWDAGNARMTIKCGGQQDFCTVELERN